MKPLSFLALGFLCMILGGCGHRRIALADYEQIKAGMTFDEVKKALSSKPAEIRKGGTVLAFSENTPEYEQFGNQATSASRIASLTFVNRVIEDSLHWRVPTVRGMGQRTYITWVMPDAPRKRDTLQVAIPIIVPDTVYTLKQVDGKTRFQRVVNEYGKVSVGFVQYVVENEYCIIFDSLSGRVAECRFLPQTVERM